MSRNDGWKSGHRTSYMHGTEEQKKQGNKDSSKRYKESNADKVNDGKRLADAKKYCSGEAQEVCSVYAGQTGADQASINRVLDASTFTVGARAEAFAFWYNTRREGVGRNRNANLNKKDKKAESNYMTKVRGDVKRIAEQRNETVALDMFAHHFASHSKFADLRPDQQASFAAFFNSLSAAQRDGWPFYEDLCEEFRRLSDPAARAAPTGGVASTASYPGTSTASYPVATTTTTGTAAPADSYSLQPERRPSAPRIVPITTGPPAPSGLLDAHVRARGLGSDVSKFFETENVSEDDRRRGTQLVGELLGGADAQAAYPSSASHDYKGKGKAVATTEERTMSLDFEPLAPHREMDDDDDDDNYDGYDDNGAGGGGGQSHGHRHHHHHHHHPSSSTHGKRKPSGSPEHDDDRSAPPGAPLTSSTTGGQAPADLSAVAPLGYMVDSRGKKGARFYLGQDGQYFYADPKRPGRTKLCNFDFDDDKMKHKAGFVYDPAGNLVPFYCRNHHGKAAFYTSRTESREGRRKKVDFGYIEMTRVAPGW